MPNWTKEQEEAIYTSGANIIVSAGAGSGKTAVLSERVIQKLKTGTHINELLILTFTKAAAAEMKERIRKKIKKEPTLIEELNKIDSAYITTFDSYALSIVKKYHYLLGMGKNISIINDSIVRLKKEEFLNEVFEEFYEKKDSSFLKLMDDFCTKDDAEIKKTILTINQKLDMIVHKDEYLKNYLDTYYTKQFIDKKIKEYEELLFRKIEIIMNDYHELEEYVEDDYFKKVQDSLEELFLSKNYKDIKQNIISLPNLPKNSEEEAKKIKERISASLKELTSLTEWEDEEELINSIFSTKEYISAMIKVIQQFDQKLQNYKSKNNLYEFNDIAKMAISILESNIDVRKSIQFSLKEIMIDEYQDTSDLQDIFISLIENNNVYMVGDIKQSIYRFRNANPNLFKEKYDHYKDKNGGIKIDLNKNFRSREEVLSDINLIFDEIMNQKIGGADYSKSHRMIFGNLTYNEKGLLEHSNHLEILNYNLDKNFEYKKEEVEIFTIASDIKEKIKNKYQVFDKDKEEVRDLKYSDIVILMDRSTNFLLYKKIFEYLNIPLSIYKDESITDSVDIKVIKNILHLILSKQINVDFEYSFVSVLRSYLFAENDATIFHYCVEKNYEESELMKKIREISYFDMTPKELILEIIDKFKIYENIIKVGDIEKHLVVLDYLVDIADDLTKMGYTVYDFSTYLDSITEKKYDITFASKKEDEGVKIMTIHKSKGLEYHICYYSGLYAKFNISELKEHFVFDTEFGIIAPYIHQGIRSIFYKELLKNKYLEEEISEKIRLFYVALTRAKEKMILITSLNLEQSNIITPVPDYFKLKYRSFLDILNSIIPKILEFIQPVELTKIGLTKDYNFIKTTNYENLIEKTDEVLKVEEYHPMIEEIKEDHFSKKIHHLLSKEEIEKMEYGTKIHQIFEEINFLDPNFTGLSKFEQSLVQKIISTGIFKSVIHIYQEYEFIYEKETTIYHGVIDLLLEYPNSFSIVDYKLKNIEDEEYMKQLMGYQEYIQTITDKKVNIYLYSILDGTLKKL